MFPNLSETSQTIIIKDRKKTFFINCEKKFEYFSFSLRIFFSVFIPIAFITTIPSEVFLGLSQLWKILLEVVVAILFLFTSRKFWLFALKFYSSASS